MAVHIGDEDVLTRVGQSAKEAIAEASRFIMPDLPPLPDMENLLGRILDTTLLSTLFEKARGLGESISVLEPEIFTSLDSNPYVTGNMLDKIRAFQTEEDEELAARMALVQYERMLETLDKAVDGLEESTSKANRNIAENLDKTFRDAGFKRSGVNYVKRTMVQATFWGEYYEDHSIEAYRYYEPHVRYLKGEMEPAKGRMIEDYGYNGIQALLNKAMNALEEEQIRIFGNGERIYILQDDSSKSGKYLNEEEYETQYAAWKKKSEDSQKSSRYTKRGKGEFNEHVGYAPQFSEDPDPYYSLSEEAMRL